MDKLIHHCVLRMIQYDVADKKQVDVIRYGLELLFSAAISFLLFTLLGWMIGKASETFLLLVCYILLQSFGGGYHCKTHTRCWMMMAADYLIGMYCITIIPEIILWCGGILGAVCFFRFAPVENPKAPFGELFRKKMHRIVMSVYLIIMVLAGIGKALRMEGMTSMFLLAVNLSGLSIFWAEMGKKHGREMIE